MGKYPYFQFYPADWIKDPDLRRCDHDAKGVWIDMLCLMHQCQDPGVLATNNIPWTKREIANAIGGKYQTVAACIDELISKGVCSIGPNGAIYSRRMVTDEKDREKEAQRKRDVRDLSGDCPGDVRDLSGSSPPEPPRTKGGQTADKGRTNPSLPPPFSPHTPLITPSPTSLEEGNEQEPRARKGNDEGSFVRSSSRSGEGGEAVVDSPTLNQALEYAKKIEVPQWKTIKWWDDLQAAKWLIKGTPVRSWRRLLDNQKARWVGDGSPKKPSDGHKEKPAILKAKPNKYLDKKPLTPEQVAAGIAAAKEMREALK